MSTDVPVEGPFQEAERGAVRQRLLDAALQIMEEEGFVALTQPRVARQAGVRQSHLTYYFPRKADLLMGVLEASHHRAHHGDPQRSRQARNFRQIVPFLQALMFDPKRARFFFSTLLEVSCDDQLRPAIAEHARGLVSFIAPYFGREADDESVQLFVDLLRGMALRKLMEPTWRVPSLERQARLLGLLPLK